MKKLMVMGVIVLAAASVMAQMVSRSVLFELCNKARKLATTEACEKFGIVMAAAGWTNNCEKPLLIDSFGSVLKYDKDGNLIQVGKGEDLEEWRWREARQKEILDVLREEAASNAVAKSCVRTLEELIPLEEAIELAKNDKGKGYFQLALRYANGQELPCDPWMAREMLRKAAEANYANAILVEGLLDEEILEETLGKPDLKAGSKKSGILRMSVRRLALREYCGNGARFDMGKRNPKFDSLTNEVAVARVMGKYEKAKNLGAWTATNQIVALNKRLADYNAKRAEEEKKESQRRAEQAIAEENDRTVEALLANEKEFRVAFKEMFGYEMGEEIAHEAGDVVEGNGNRYRCLELRKPYREFQWLRIDCMNDRLWRAGMQFETTNRSASASFAQMGSSIKEDLWQRYGSVFYSANCAERPFYSENRAKRSFSHKKRAERQRNDWVANDHGWKFCVDVEDEYVSVWVEDANLKEKLKKEARENSGRQREIVLPPNVALGAWTDNFDAAKMLSKEKNLPIMLNFTGSDWCGWCKRMEENVFSQKAWKDWAKENLVCVMVDFPSDRTKVSPSVRDQNSKLIKRFGIAGVPTFVLLAPGGDTAIGFVDGGNHATPQEFINRLQEAQKKFQEAQTKLQEAQKAEEAQKRVRRTMDLVASGKSYCVIDLSGGADAESYPVAYLDREPSGGFNAPEYKTTKLVLKRVDAGSFIMGANQTNEAHRVTLAKPFYMGLFEVTQKQWKLVMGANPSKDKGDKDPVCNVCYDMIRGSYEGSEWPMSNAVDAGSFLGRLRAKTRLDFDLPTEAQWEYTCRAGTKTRFSHGDNEDRAYYADDQHDALEVGTRKPNPWGFYDMHGNVWEWCLDWFLNEWTKKELQQSSRTRGARSRGTRSRNTALKGYSLETYRVMRGGSYDNKVDLCTSFGRGCNDPSGSILDYCHGFRLSLHDDAKTPSAHDDDTKPPASARQSMLRRSTRMNRRPFRTKEAR